MICFTILFNTDSGTSNKTTLGIFYTNCMNFVDESAALFPTMARSNHSCTPNSEFITRDDLGNRNNFQRRNTESSILVIASNLI